MQNIFLRSGVNYNIFLRIYRGHFSIEHPNRQVHPCSECPLIYHFIFVTLSSTAFIRRCRARPFSTSSYSLPKTFQYFKRIVHYQAICLGRICTKCNRDERLRRFYQVDTRWITCKYTFAGDIRSKFP